MKKNCIVRLSDEEREFYLAVVKKLKGPSAKVRLADFCSKRMLTGRIGKTGMLPTTRFRWSPVLMSGTT